MSNIDDFSRHPIGFLRVLRSKYGNNIELSFSRYRYIRRVREDVRRSFRVAVRDVTRKWLANELAELLTGEELAIESRVSLERERRHIPMLDFVGMERAQLAAVMEVLPQYPTRQALVYKSGRSFHAYFPVLITPAEWIQFMGSALLCNTPSHPRIVDPRWIGHRLISGYAALRWSWNTSSYRAAPTKVKVETLL
jgi:hypothetical protein